MAELASCGRKEPCPDLGPKHQDDTTESDDEFGFPDLSPRILSETYTFDADTELSEMPLDSPGTNRVVISQDTVSNPQCKLVAAPPQLLTRPDSSGIDVALQFHMAPSRSNKSKSTSRKTHSARMHSLQYEQERQIDTVQAACCDKSTDADTIEKLYMANGIRDGTTNIEDTLMHEDPECEKSQRDTGANSSIQSSTATLQEEEPNNMDCVTRSEHSHTHNPQECDRGVSSISTIQKDGPSPVMTERTPVSEHHEETMHQSLSSHHEDETPIVGRPPQDCMISKQNVPSEEDLLLLLARRSRQREQDILRESMRIAYLEKENKDLQRVKLALRDELEAAVTQRDKLLDSAGAVQDEMEMFRDKYRKLKTWALEMNSEYAAVRQVGCNLRAALSYLQRENKEARKPISDAVKSNEETKVMVERIKQTLNETRVSIQSLDSNLHQARASITEKNIQIRTLKVSNLEYKLHIRELSTRQERFDNQTRSRQENVLGALHALSEKIGTLVPQTRGDGDLQECLNLVKKLAESGFATDEGLKTTESTLMQLSEQLKTVHAAIEKSSEAQSHTCDSSFVEELGLIQKSLERLKPDMAKVEKLQQENARLLEKSNSDTAIRNLVHEAKSSAEARRLEVQRNNDKLIDSLTSTRQAEEKCHSQQASEAEARFGEAITKWTMAASRTSKELAEAKAQASTYEVELKKIRERLEERQTFYANQRRDCDAQHDQAIRLLQEENIVEQNRIRSGLEKQIELRDLEMNCSTRALEDAKKEIEAAKQDVSNLVIHKDDLVQDLQCMRQKLDESVRSLEEQKQSYDKLQSNFDSMKHELSRKTELVETQLVEIVELKNRHETLNNFFTQNTNLSIGMNETQSQETEGDSVSHKDHRAETVTEICSETVNPRFITCTVSTLSSTGQSLNESGPLSQAIVIPDSQLQINNELCDASQAQRIKLKAPAQSSSPLTEINTDDIGLYNEVENSRCGHGQDLDNADDELGGTGDDFDIPPASPQLPRFRASRISTRRPSVTHDEMLLQASETGRHSSPRGSRAQHAHPALQSVKHSKTDHTNDGLGPHTSSGNSEGQTSGLNTNMTSTALTTPSVTFREPNRPNSAVKRHIDNEIGANINERHIGKKLKLPNVRPGNKISINKVQTTTPVSMSSGRMDELPSGSRSGNAAAESGSTTRKASKRVLSGRTRSRQDRYAQRFNGSSQS